MLKFLVLPGVEAKSNNMLVNPFVPKAPFLYPLKRCTGNEWVKKLSKNMKKLIQLVSFNFSFCSSTIAFWRETIFSFVLSDFSVHFLWSRNACHFFPPPIWQFNKLITHHFDSPSLSNLLEVSISWCHQRCEVPASLIRESCMKNEYSWVL